MSRKAPDDPALRALFWRDEILQVMYWLSGESLASDVTAAELARFLDHNTAELSRSLSRLTQDGYVGLVGAERYALTDAGALRGRRSFEDEFSGMVSQAHGECGADCWCHRSSEDARSCLEERLAQ